MGLQPLESLLSKAIQLYEMVIVRHGLMLVGDSYGMKTTTWRVLAAALTGEYAHACPGLIFSLQSDSVTRSAVGRQ
jgi:hypothetical protein